MRRFAFLVPLFALAMTGCGDPPPLPMAGTPESTRATLTTALDGWKAGKLPKDLSEGSPPLAFIDDDINRPDTKLTDYKIEGDGTPRGTGYSYIVVLTLQTADGTRTKRNAYTAVTSPNHAVTKEDRQP